jgi:GNAT superfamily N-acetyltransferase
MKCPRLRLKATALTPNGFEPVAKRIPAGSAGLRVFAEDSAGNVVGELSVRNESVTRDHLMAKAVGGQEFLEPGWIQVARGHQRCGIGTQLYTFLAKLAKASKLPLTSSRERSERSEAFWAKQHKKGRATCLPNQPGYSSARGYWNPEMDRIDWATNETWPCWRYVLKSGQTNLSDARRRRKARK